MFEKAPGARRHACSDLPKLLRNLCHDVSFVKSTAGVYIPQGAENDYRYVIGPTTWGRCHKMLGLVLSQSCKILCLYLYIVFVWESIDLICLISSYFRTSYSGQVTCPNLDGSLERFHKR